jgi:hypothetical protein
MGKAPLLAPPAPMGGWVDGDGNGNGNHFNSNTSNIYTCLQHMVTINHQNPTKLTENEATQASALPDFSIVVEIVKGTAKLKDFPDSWHSCCLHGLAPNKNLWMQPPNLKVGLELKNYPTVLLTNKLKHHQPIEKFENVKASQAPKRIMGKIELARSEVQNQWNTS